MTPVPVNYLAVIVAALISMAVGFLWYGPLFGKIWMKENGWNPEKLKGMKPPNMTKQYSIQFVGALFMSYVLASALLFASSYLGTSGISAGLMVGFWNWLGFIAPVTLVTVLYERKSWKLWFLNNSYYLVSLILMGILLALWI